MEKVLLIAIPQAEQVEQLAVKQHLRAVHIQPSAYGQSIGQLAGYAVPADAAGTAADELPPTGLLVFCGLRNSHMDRFCRGCAMPESKFRTRRCSPPPTSTGRYSSWRGNWSGSASR